MDGNNIETIAASASAIIAAIALIISIIINHKDKKAYIQSREPCLSAFFKVDGYKVILSIKNVGFSVAKDIKIQNLRLTNNISFDVLPTPTFSIVLYPGEEISFCIMHQNICNGIADNTFALFDIKYISLNTNKPMTINKTVLVAPVPVDNVNKTLKTMRDELDKSSLSLTRIANYLTGILLIPGDGIKQLLGRTMRDDIHFSPEANTEDEKITSN